MTPAAALEILIIPLGLMLLIGLAIGYWLGWTMRGEPYQDGDE